MVWLWLGVVAFSLLLWGILGVRTARAVRRVKDEAARFRRALD